MANSSSFSASEHMPDEARLKELLMGKSIVSAEVKEESPEEYHSRVPTGYLTLSDGTVLKVWGNDGGCACSAGCYPLATLAGTDNIITNVIVEEEPDGDDSNCRKCGKSRWSAECTHYDEDGYYRIFVLAYGVDEPINVASFEGSDGNGYYGTGWWLSVSKEPVTSPYPFGAAS